MNLRKPPSTCCGCGTPERIADRPCRQPEDGTYCDEASRLAEHKLQDVRAKLANLARMEFVLSPLVCACHARKGNVSCPLIASLQGEASLATSAGDELGRAMP